MTVNYYNPELSHTDQRYYDFLIRQKDAIGIDKTFLWLKKCYHAHQISGYATRISEKIANFPQVYLASHPEIF
jgi:hypothetical protein